MRKKGIRNDESKSEGQINRWEVRADKVGPRGIWHDEERITKASGMLLLANMNNTGKND